MTGGGFFKLRLWLLTALAYAGLLLWLPAFQGQAGSVTVPWLLRILAGLAALVSVAAWSFFIAHFRRAYPLLNQRLTRIRRVSRTPAQVALAIVVLLEVASYFSAAPLLGRLETVAAAVYAGACLLLVAESAVLVQSLPEAARHRELGSKAA